MEQKKHTNSSDEIIDFDDEFSSNQLYTDDQLPDAVPKQKNKNILEDQVQPTPEEEDQDQKDEILNEDNIIYDPKVKELNEIDINNKKAILDILMDDDLI